MAYSRYQYETSPRKIQPEYKPTKKKKNVSKNSKSKNKMKNTNTKKASNKNPKMVKASKRKATIYVIMAFAILFTISYRNALISQKYSEVKKMESNLASLKKENDQLEVNIETNLNLQNVEKAAEEKLGMQKVSNTQTIYVNLPREDYIEPASETVETSKETSWFMEIWNLILEYIK